MGTECSNQKKYHDGKWDWVKYADHEQALAEKDREIAHLQDVYTRQRIKLEDAYQQLMEQAIAFAENMIYVMGALVSTREELEDNGHVIASRKFLGSPEVHAFLKEREGT